MSSPASVPVPAGDAELVSRAASGDERALAALYDRYGGVLYAVAYRITGQRADAEEVVLEAFAQAWRDAPRFDSARGSVAGWLTVIARSRALDLVRARGRRDRITASAAAQSRRRFARHG
jgi:RNA polymerase sigma-70 factor (ECF subfamily)